ncbi:MAG: E3 ubiquitin protein ligase [Candidatus Lokiarchaeota archaeon]|nr:E3 ubiquitin protein ligase [Candidatus Lokiarchaeota archaeon]
MADIQDFINQIHDVTLEKSHVINDKNYRRYLPKRHRFLRSVYQTWACLFPLSILIAILYFVVQEAWVRALVYNGLLVSMIYSLFVLLLSIGLYSASYTVPIAVTNEVKSKMVVKMNKRLEVLKEALERAFTNSIIADGLHKGKFNLKDIRASVMDFIQKGFPNVQYIKEMVSDEIIKPVEKSVANYIAEMSSVLVAKLKDSPVKIQQVAEATGTKAEFVVLMVKWMLDKGMLDGMLTEFDMEYVPSGATPLSIAQAMQPAQPAMAMQKTAGGIPVDAPIFLDQQGKPAATLVQSPGSSNLPSIDAVKIRLAEKKQEIEAAKAAYERGDIGIDAYVSKSETLESQLDFLKHRLALLEKVQDPKHYCLICFQSIAGDGGLVRCPNDHAFHLDHAQGWLAKHEECPWCEQKINAFPSP